MARIRTIKPDFWTDEKIGTLRRDVRLLYIGLWNLADDKGVLKANPAFIKGQIFPYDEDLRIGSVKEWIDSLENARMLVPFTYNGESYFIIRTFLAHQNINRPTASKIPDNVILNAIKGSSHNTHTQLTEDSPLEIERKGNRKEGKGEEFTHTREPELENSILDFFGFSEHTNFDKARTVKDFIFSLKNFLRLDFFRKQFDAYVELKSLDNGLYKHSFKNFIGDQSERFENGAWNAENWEQRLNEEKEKSSGKKEKAANTTKSQPIRGIEAAMKVAEVQMRD